MTTKIKDLKDNSEYAARQYEIYLRAVKRIGDTNSLREANEGLGYNLVKTIPGLLERIQVLEDENVRLKSAPKDSDTKRPVGRPRLHPKESAIDHPLGIPEDHIVLDVSESLELEVVTEEVPEAKANHYDGEEDEGEPEEVQVSPLAMKVLHDYYKPGGEYDQELGRQ